MIKQIRKFSNMTIACITDSDILRQELSEVLKEARKIEFVNDVASVFDTKSDIVIVDYNMENSIDIMKGISNRNPLLPKIAIIDNMAEEIIIDCLNVSVVSIVKSPISSDDLRLSIMVALNKSRRADKIFLNHGFYYDAYRERFYDKDGEIALTNFEFNLLKLLIDNPERIVSYDEIKEKVWKEKKMSIFTMRNVVNKIRKKTYQGIIKNNSSKGYQVDSIQQ